LGPDRQGDAQGLGRFGEMAIDQRGPLWAAGHGADQQRRGQGTPEQAGAEVDIVEVQFGQGAVREAVGVEARGDGAAGLVGIQHDVQMIVLAACQFPIHHVF